MRKTILIFNSIFRNFGETHSKLLHVYTEIHIFLCIYYETICHLSLSSILDVDTSIFVVTFFAQRNKNFANVLITWYLIIHFRIIPKAFITLPFWFLPIFNEIFLTEVKQKTNCFFSKIFFQFLSIICISQISLLSNLVNDQSWKWIGYKSWKAIPSRLHKGKF